jgi:hypothetical protein
MHLSREVFASEKDAKMADSLFWDVPLKITAFLNRMEVVAGFLFHLADDAFRDGFLILDMSSREIDAWPILLFSIDDQKGAILLIEHAHVGQDDFGVSHQSNSRLYGYGKKS